ncbi:App1 family protein [Aquimarina pacifica]|uniref:App1 family protein n=1 Tax=Aquimarina pacifica TaxID=1296415 RepID=UPI0004B6C471|nr:phosphatase domain-containing protein [Aquimarina pacifica]
MISIFRKKALRINTYLGYGTDTLFRATGRALEDENIDFGINQNIFKTLRNIYRQFESDEVRNIPIKVTLPNGEIIETTTDQEGYYQVELSETVLSDYTDKEGWIPYIVSYQKEAIKKRISHKNVFQSKMLIPSSKASFGIISDIDDTILHTGVASFFKWKVIANTIFKNFDKRIATEGTVFFYKKLNNTEIGVPSNPFFYVSNSPWNLYDYLSAFFEKNHFPPGPILLRDFRTPFDKTPKPKMPHKQSEIINLLEMYPNLNYILIGDSGEKDADIYTTIAEEYPNRILAIYLRNVRHLKKEKRIQKIITSFNACPILLFTTSEEAVLHAKKMGFIN